MYVGILSTHMYANYMLAWVPWRTEKSIRYPGNGVIHSFEQPCVCWEEIPDPTQK